MRHLLVGNGPQGCQGIDGCERLHKFRKLSGGGIIRLIRLRILCSALVLLPFGSAADVFKYVDAQGNVFFSDEPLSSPTLRLEWKRTAARLAAQNRQVSRTLREERAEAQARLEARLQALDGDGAIVGRRPTDAVSGSMWERRLRYESLIQRAADRHGLMPELLHAVIRTESAYKPNALSHAGACGLMQLMPGTAARFRVDDIWDPAENIEGGAAYLRFLLDLFEYDLRLALAGYNAGENAVKRYGNQIPPYPETEDYVRKVLQFLWAEQEHRPS
ncbi:lytic transglycosylase domain-containing protein [Halochromatium glycolicum]|uniref:Transglycosylase SLT domain-containing protein n=1 Tax=Halochromatium glycolicum TaxID=85075 RepID=A0AAJ0U2R6_9GAMM|nr:lytic transglycosylase domain-containing protein [Halochromatium glycolicum]MBK1704220.1 hypothetical protein [Halochromatium glycolicum]